MLHDTALGIDSTRTWARVGTLLIDARQVTWALRIDNTLWPTVRGTSDIVGATRAHALVTNDATLRVRSTWRGNAWIPNVLAWDGIVLFNMALDERISGVASAATTNGIVVDHLAIGIYAASSRTRIRTLLINAGAILRAL